MDEEEHHKKPGYVCERIVEGGVAVLFDGKQFPPEKKIPNKKNRWVIQHFPYNSIAYFPREKDGRLALDILEKGIDKWYLLCPPEDKLTPTNAQITPSSGTLRRITDSGHVSATIERIYPTEDMVTDLVIIAKTAMKPGKDGGVIEDAPTRFNAIKFLVEMTHGKPRQQQDIVHRNATDTPEEFLKKLEANPELARSVMEVIRPIVEQHDKEKM